MPFVSLTKQPAVLRTSSQACLQKRFAIEQQINAKKEEKKIFRALLQEKVAVLGYSLILQF